MIGVTYQIVGKNNLVAGKRTDNDPCGIARALDVVGERWALLVVRELLLGPKRFTDLRGGLPSLSPDVLSQRLRELEGNGLLARRKLGPPAGSQVYELTDRGRQLEPVILALGRWGSAAPFPSPLREIGADSMVLALKTVFDPAAAAGLDAEIGLRLRDDAYRIRIADGRVEAARGEPAAPDLTLATTPGVLAALAWEGRDVEDAVRAGEATFEGERQLLDRFVSLFALGP
jgi:DNA-binding HxlR family transcriptional regulator